MKSCIFMVILIMIYFINFNIDPAITYTFSTAEYVLNIVNDFGNCLTIN